MLIACLNTSVNFIFRLCELFVLNSSESGIFGNQVKISNFTNLTTFASNDFTKVPSSKDYKGVRNHISHVFKNVERFESVVELRRVGG